MLCVVTFYWSDQPADAVAQQTDSVWTHFVYAKWHPQETNFYTTVADIEDSSGDEEETTHWSLLAEAARRARGAHDSHHIPRKGCEPIGCECIEVLKGLEFRPKQSRIDRRFNAVLTQVTNVSYALTICAVNSDEHTSLSIYDDTAAGFGPYTELTRLMGEIADECERVKETDTLQVMRGKSLNALPDLIRVVALQIEKAFLIWMPNRDQSFARLTAGKPCPMLLPKWYLRYLSIQVAAAAKESNVELDIFGDDDYTLYQRIKFGIGYADEHVVIVMEFPFVRKHEARGPNLISERNEQTTKRTFRYEPAIYVRVVYWLSIHAVIVFLLVSLFRTPAWLVNVWSTVIVLPTDVTAKAAGEECDTLEPLWPVLEMLFFVAIILVLWLKIGRRIELSYFYGFERVHSDLSNERDVREVRIEIGFVLPVETYSGLLYQQIGIRTMLSERVERPCGANKLRLTNTTYMFATVDKPCVGTFLKLVSPLQIECVRDEQVVCRTECVVEIKLSNIRWQDERAPQGLGSGQFGVANVRLSNIREPLPEPLYENIDDSSNTYVVDTG